MLRVGTGATGAADGAFAAATLTRVTDLAWCRSTGRLYMADGTRVRYLDTRARVVRTLWPPPPPRLPHTAPAATSPAAAGTPAPGRQLVPSGLVTHVAVSPDGAVHATFPSLHAVWLVHPDGGATLVAGTPGQRSCRRCCAAAAAAAESGEAPPAAACTLYGADGSERRGDSCDAQPGHAAERVLVGTTASAQLDAPAGICFNGGTLVIADARNHRVALRLTSVALLEFYRAMGTIFSLLKKKSELTVRPLARRFAATSPRMHAAQRCADARATSPPWACRCRLRTGGTCWPQRLCSSEWRRRRSAPFQKWRSTAASTCSSGTTPTWP
jgi:hypothetical protein